MKDYVMEMANEIQELVSSGNELKAALSSVLVKHIAALEEKVYQLCAVRGMPTKACGVDALVRGRKEIEQRLHCYEVHNDMDAGIVNALKWVLFELESI